MNDTPLIIHQDDDLIVVDKPAGWPVASLEEGTQRTVAAWLLEQFPGQAVVSGNPREAGFAHRLDNDTSGLLVAARTGEALLHLRNQFRNGTVRKEYTALVLGNPPQEGSIDSPIAHHPRKKKKMVVCESKTRAEELKARAAETLYRVTQRFLFPSPFPSPLGGEGGVRGGAAPIRYSLLSVTITTGVRHQIRAHLASIGHPIAGDRLYQNPKMRAADPLPLSRQFLHASRVAFAHPTSGAEISFSSDLPDDLQAALSMLPPLEH